MKCHGKVALVTGGARRLGAEMVRFLASRGAAVVLHYNTGADPARDLVREIEAQGGRALAFGGDLRAYQAVDDLFARLDEGFGRLDILVNSASVFRRRSFDDLDYAEWREQLEVNLDAPFRLVRHAVPRMRAAGGGLIVNMVDLSAYRPWRTYLAHSVSKAGLLALTQGLARELAPAIRVNAICPGAVLWPEGADETERAAILERVPLKRAGAPADVVRALEYLLDADYVTGEVMVVDGGRAVRA